MKVEGQTEGNGAIAVLVHDCRKEALDCLEKAVFSALRHLGIPFRCISIDDDLSDAAFRDLAAGHRAVLLPQSGTCARLSRSRIEALVTSCREEGLGLVMYEEAVSGLPAELRRLCALSGDMEETSASFRDIRRTASDHYIGWLGAPGEQLHSDSDIPCTLIFTPGEDGAGTGCGFRTEAGFPLALARQSGRGRIVLFPFAVRLYTMEGLGHASGLDDIFYRSIVWAARKPFFTWTMPKVAGLVIDDCSGSYDHFGYLDVLEEHGWKPHLSLFTDTIDEVAHEDIGLDSLRLRKGHSEGNLEIGFHALRYNESFCFDHLGRHPLTREELDARFERWDSLVARWKIPHSPWLHPHFGEIGAAALPYCRARGIEFITWLLPLDAAWFDVPARIPHMSPQPPYGHNGYYMTRMPGHPDLVAFNCVLDRKTRESSDYVVKTDYLWGNTVFWNESESTNMEEASLTLATQIRRGLDAGFYGEGATHEQRMACLRKGELREIFQEADRLLERHDPERLTMSRIMSMAGKRLGTGLEEVEIPSAGFGAEYRFSSPGAAGTECQLHGTTEEGWVESRSFSVDGMQGRVEGSFPGSARSSRRVV